MGKEKIEKKKSKKSSKESGDKEIKVTTNRFISPYAVPMALDSSEKKLLKVAKKAHAQKHVFRGVQETVKAVRKGRVGFALIAADVSPPDVISHLPVLFEEANIPYTFTATKQDLGLSVGTKRATSALLISPNGLKAGGKVECDYKDAFEEAIKEIKSLA